MRRLRIFLTATGIAFGVLSLCAGLLLGLTVVLPEISEQYGALAAVAFLIAWLSIILGAILAAIY